MKNRTYEKFMTIYFNNDCIATIIRRHWDGASHLHEYSIRKLLRYMFLFKPQLLLLTLSKKQYMVKDNGDQSIVCASNYILFGKEQHSSQSPFWINENKKIE